MSNLIFCCLLLPMNGCAAAGGVEYWEVVFLSLPPWDTLSVLSSAIFLFYLFVEVELEWVLYPAKWRDGKGGEHRSLTKWITLGLLQYCISFERRFSFIFFSKAFFGLFFIYEYIKLTIALPVTVLNILSNKSDSSVLWHFLLYLTTLLKARSSHLCRVSLTRTTFCGYANGLGLPRSLSSEVKKKGERNNLVIILNQLKYGLTQKRWLFFSWINFLDPQYYTSTRAGIGRQAGTPVQKLRVCSYPAQEQISAEWSWNFTSHCIAAGNSRTFIWCPQISVQWTIFTTTFTYWLFSIGHSGRTVLQIARNSQWSHMCQFEVGEWVISFKVCSGMELLVE